MGINKILFLLTFSFILPALSQIICSNPFTTKFGFTGPTIAAVVPNIRVCKSLQNAATCCSVNVFNTLQRKTDEMIDTIRKNVIARDQVLTNIRQEVLPPLVEIIKRLKTAIDKLATLSNASVRSLSRSSVVENFSGITGIIAKVSKLKSNFIEYQKTRTTCIINMVKLQAATWCLACDASYSTKGLTADGVLTISANVCSKLRNACFDYLSGTDEQNTLLEINLMSPLLEEITKSLEKAASGDLNGVSEFYTLLSRTTYLKGPSNNAEIPVDISSTCTRNSCDFICNDLFKQGTVNLNILSYGGQLSLVRMSRILDEKVKEEAVTNNRVLEGSSWDFDIDEAGVTVKFEDDPGNTNGSGLSRVRYILAGISVILWVFII